MRGGGYPPSKPKLRGYEEMPNYCHSCQHCTMDVYYWGDRKAKPSAGGSHPVFSSVCGYNYNGATDIVILPWNYDLTPCPRYLAKG